ncbi:class I SAM-dependent methyltransferase [Solihabitans fulvus]|uniref:Class I SAM-dependent methyltransferase n=2 Tax=Solihabitans fulvus TaxID=1892852 RepID=A0A5B2W5H7_9PSEU|nr:class I SAM-dependent methyltransferase [Solihabitans fulvus]
MMRANQSNWDARTPIHAASAFYGLDGSRSPFDWFAAFEWADLGDLAGRDVLHLQCHLGTETLAFAHQGARTWGLDLSGRSVEEARRIAQRAGLTVTYVQANVYDAVQAVRGQRFDVVYTGKGALCYLPDLPRWASVVSDLLRPGGLLYVVEFHPLFSSLGPKPPRGAGPELLLRNDYLEGRGALERGGAHTYTDGPALQDAPVAYEWAHGLGEVVTAVAGAGLRITALRESELLPWPRWERMERTDTGWWRLPEADPRIPLLYGLRASKPE